MNLNISRYQAAQPYPVVRHAHPDPKLSAAILEGYCGETSELTTVLQYNYHSLCGQAQYKQIARTMRGIFYVETLHLEFLGEVLIKLGTDPQYLLSLQERYINWQSSLVNYGCSVEEMLLADIAGEKEAAAYYRELASTVEQAEIARLMDRLARDEELHVRMLTNLHRQYFGR